MDTEKNQSIEPIIKLFINWHNNEDPNAGNKMADRFELWFDSLSSFYLGENSQKQQVYKNVCQKFSNNIKQIKKPKDLVPFAYDILHREMPSDLIDSKKEYNTNMLQNRSPKELLSRVWEELSIEDQKLLLENYNGEKAPRNLYKLLQARNHLKQQLQTQGIDFVSLNENVDRDLLPLPLFEANKLKSQREVQYFEFWLLNAPSICRDISEFAPFAHALRTGAITAPVTEKKAEPAVEPEKTELIKEDPQESTPAVEQKKPDLEITQSVNQPPSVMKPILLAVVIAVVLTGLYIVLSSK